MRVDPELLRLAGTEAGIYRFTLSTTEDWHKGAGSIRVYGSGGFICRGVIAPGGRAQGEKRGRPFQSIKEAGDHFFGYPK